MTGIGDFRRGSSGGLGKVNQNRGFSRLDGLNDQARLLSRKQDNNSDEGEAELKNLEPKDVQSASRMFLLELVSNLVVFIICTMVCLEVFAAAQQSLERDRAVSELGQTSVSMIENWKAGSDLEDLSRRFGGIAEGDRLVLSYNRAFQLTDQPGQVKYRLIFTTESDGSGYSSGNLKLYYGDELLLDWDVGRNDNRMRGQ